MISRIFWNYQERRLRAIWRIIIQGGLFLTFYGILIVGLVLFWIGISTLTGGSSLGEVGLFEVPFLTFYSETLPGITLNAVISLLAILTSYWIAGKWIDKRSFQDFGFHFNKGWWLSFGFGLLLGAVMMGIIFTLEYWAGWVEITGFLQPGLTGWFGLDLTMAGILFICTGIFEEMLVRGYQMRNLGEGFNWKGIHPKTGLVLAYLLSAILFGLLHSDNPFASVTSTINLILAGLFLGAGYLLTGELAIPIGLHITWNFFEGNIFGFPVSGIDAGATLVSIQQSGSTLWTGGNFGPEAGLVSVFAILIGGLLIAVWVKKTKGKVAIAEELAQYWSNRHKMQA
jgi:uncharacterized protein